jgi:hypothetical protein
MDNTKRTLAIAAVFVAVALVVGTFGSISTIAQSAFAYPQKKDNGKGNGNGNTVTIEECKNKGSASGFDTTTNQECENLICTHPGVGATCVSEAAVVSNQTGGGVKSDPCLTCFTQSLSATEQTNFVNLVASQFGFKVSSIEDICKIINTGTISGGQIELVLGSLIQRDQISTAHAQDLLNCLVQAGLIDLRG